MQEKHNVTWNDIEIHAKNLSVSILKRTRDIERKYDTIISLGRGGMVPSRLLSDYIGVPNVKFLATHKYSQYNTDNPADLEIDMNFNWKSLEDKNILLVDDVYDTGQTVQFVTKTIFENVTECLVASAVLYCNVYKLTDDSIKKNDTPTYHSGSYNPEDTWIVFPWENNKISIT